MATSLKTETTAIVCLEQAWDVISQESDQNLPIPGTADQLAYVIYTSGSTGIPKGVMVSHQAVSRLVCNTNYVQIEPDDCMAQVANLAFDAATFEVWGALLNGAQLVGIDREIILSPLDFIDTLQQEQISILFLTTALLNQVVQQAPSGLQSLKYLLFGGELVNHNYVRALVQQGKPQHLIHVYGPTENTTFSTWYEVKEVPEQVTTIPIGKAISHTQVFVLDSHLNPVPAGVSGEIYLGGAGLARGYLNRSELTAERFVQVEFPALNSDLTTVATQSKIVSRELPTQGTELYKTGDRALYRADGNLEFLGRSDAQIKIRGFRVELGEIEAALAQHAGIQTAVAIVRQIADDQQLIAYIVPQTTDMPTERELRAFLKLRLPIYMVPTAFVVLDALPLTVNGKVNQQALPCPDLTVTQPAAMVAPMTSLEAGLVELWSQLLGRKFVSIHDNFFELGGHSLLATQLVSRIRDRWQIELPLRSLFEAPTLAALADKMKCLQVEPISSISGQNISGQASSGLPDSQANSQSSKPTPTISLGSSQLFPLSFAQQRLWFLYQLAPDNPFYNVPAAIQLTGRLNQLALQRSLDQIVRRHATLRTTFTTVDGQPMQVVAANAKIELVGVNLQRVVSRDRDSICRQLSTAEAQRPFNLTTDLGLRVTLLEFSPTDAVLLLTLHHIVADGWSLGVLLQELVECYTAFSNGRSPLLLDLPIQYTDFANWQRNWLQGNNLEHQLRYWRTQLQDLSVLQLPSDRPRPTVQTYRGATYPLQLSPALTQGLAQFSQQSGVSLFMTLLAAFQALLYRYTGQEDIAVGSPIANRHRSEVEGLIGFFVNSLVLRSNTSGNPTFSEFLKQVAEVALAAYDHQDLPFEKLVEELDPDRDLSRNPLFQVAFALQNAPIQPLELPELALKPTPLESASTRFDLEVHLWEPSNGLASLWRSQDGLSGFISYSTDLFDRDRISRMVGHFQTLLAGIVANPHLRLSDLPLLTPAEYHQIFQWQRSSLTLAQPEESRSGAFATNDQGNLTSRCFHHIFADQVRQDPTAIALVAQEGTLTYAELNQRANDVAVVLQQQGVQPDTLVGICVERSLDLVIGILGILKAGGAYVPLDPVYPRDRLQLILIDTQVGLLLTQSWLVASLPPSSAQILCLDQPLPFKLAPLISTVTPDHLAYVIYTSGSTGQPKGVLLSHSGLSHIVKAQQQLLQPSRPSRILQFSSVSFDASIFEITLALGSGATLYIPPKSAQLPGLALTQFLADNAITHALLTPPVLAVLPIAELPALRVLITGGDRCSSQVIDRWAMNRCFFNAYGPTEATIWATLAELNPGDHPQIIGRPIPQTQVYILDPYLKPVPAGIPGELYIGGAGVARGYLNRPELTTERFIQVNLLDLDANFNPATQAQANAQKVRLYKTGDRAQYRANGMIEFLGREDNQIKIRGYRVELGEIEATLKHHPAIQDAVTIAVNREPHELRLVTYFSPNYAHLQKAIFESLKTQQIQSWQTLYDQTYQTTDQTENSDLKIQNPRFNIVGWNSSYTGAAIPSEEMQEWLSDRVEQILALRPRRILEIGCGTGLLLFQIAPHCEKYIGTDFSAVTLELLQTELADLPQVELRHQMATDFAGIDPGEFDLVILNSVVQYFPSADYLLQVLTGVMQAIAPGGTIFLGDLRSLPLLPAFHAWVQFCQADDSLERTQLQQLVERSQFEEPELAIDPAFFQTLCDRFATIDRVQIRLSRGHSQNELTQFRYNVLLHVANPSIAGESHRSVPLGSIQDYDWKQDLIQLEAIQKYLIHTELDALLITNVTNSRVKLAIETVNWLNHQTSPKTVGRMREIMQETTSAIAPQAWWDLESTLPYQVEITWSAASQSGDYDVLLLRRGLEQTINFPEQQSCDRAHFSFTNHPLQSSVAHHLIPELRQHLKRTLPDYMVPSIFIPRAALPLTASGKIDRNRLLAQYQRSLVSAHPDLSHSSSHVVPATSPLQMTCIQLTLTDIWQELLRIKPINPHDNFFELGGHSLLATQMTSRIRDLLGLELPLQSVFAAPTIAQLAAILETLSTTTLPPTPPLVRLDRTIHRTSFVNLRHPIDAALKSPAKDSGSHSGPDAGRSPLVLLTLGGNQPPFFCVHPMFGVVLPYLELAHHLGSHRSFYGLQASGLDGKSMPLNRIEAIAANYIQAIQTLQPQGPYLLGGWSFGGLVAFEMAQQLSRAGHEIKLLALLDTPAPCHKPSLAQSLQFLLGTALWSTLPFLRDYGVLAAQRLPFWNSWLSRRQWSAIIRLIPDESRLQLWDESAIAPMLPIVYAHAQAAYRYRPQFYANRITLFKAAEQSEAIGQDTTLGWSKLAQDVDLHSVSGNHLSLLQNPHVVELAQHLQQYLS